MKKYLYISSIIIFALVAISNNLFAQPSNNDCSGAIELTPAAACSYSTFDNTSATDSGEGTPGCASLGPDVWFYFTIPASGTVEIDTEEIDFSDGAMAVYTGNNCSSLTELDCDDDGGTNSMPYLSLTGLTPGETIYIRVWEYGGDLEGEFGICVIEAPAPVDPCASVIPIATCGVGDEVTFTSSATSSWASNPCYSSPGGEQIYSFTPTATSTYSFEITADGTYVDYLWQEGSCASTGWTCVDDILSSGTYGTMNWTAGTTYYIYLDDENTTTSTSSFYVTCPLCNPANSTITQTCAGDNLSYDLEVDITSLVEAASVDIIIGGTTEETNVGVGTYTYNGLTTGTTVSIVDNADATCVLSDFLFTCNPCILPNIPSDECSSAPLIDLSQPFEGSTDCSYTVGAESPAESCGAFIDNDSWITFIAGSDEVEMEFTIGDCSNDDGIQLNVFSGTCGSLVEIPGCVNPTGELTTGTWNFSGLTIGDTYYIRIDGFSGDLCDYYFEPISGVVVTPPNNACDDAIALNCGETSIASNILADAVDSPSGCSGGGTPGDGVWYSFIGDGSEVTISTDNPATNFDTEINIFEGPCTALTCIGGDNDGGVGMTSEYTFTTTNGTEYFIYVDGDGTAAGQFEVSLSCNSAPPCDADAGTWD